MSMYCFREKVGRAGEGRTRGTERLVGGSAAGAAVGVAEEVGGSGKASTGTEWPFYRSLGFGGGNFASRIPDGLPVSGRNPWGGSPGDKWSRF